MLCVLHRLNGELASFSTVKDGNKQAKAFELMAKTHDLVQKVGGAHKAEVQTLLAAGKAGKNHARLRTVNPTRCDQAKGEYMTVFMPPFCAMRDGHYAGGRLTF